MQSKPECIHDVDPRCRERGHLIIKHDEGMPASERKRAKVPTCMRCGLTQAEADKWYSLRML